MDQSHSIFISPDPARPGPVKARGQRQGWRRVAGAVASLVIAVGVVGCTNKKEAPARPSAASLANPTDRDMNSKALGEADRQLSQATYTILEKKGPKGRGVSGLPSPADNGSALITNGASAERVPSTQPLNEAELPVTSIQQPDGKVKLIWVLRSYGGSSVTSSRVENRRNVVIAPPDLTPLVTVMAQQVGAAGAVVPLPQVNTIVVTCDPSLKASVLQTLNELDRPVRQVEITAKIFEVSQDFDYQQGARLMANRIGNQSSQSGLSTFDTQKFAQATGGAAGGPFQGSVISLMQASTDAGLSLEASFQLLAEVGLIKVVSSPRMTVAVGQTGYMLAGQEIPIQSANIVNNVVQANTTYKPVGVQLYITPQAIGDNKVKLHTVSIVSSISGFTNLPTLIGGTRPNGLVNPVIDAREAETAVTIENGSTLVISGMRTIRTTAREQKVPGLGDVPLLGEMFKNHRSQQQSTDLYFFVTPTLL
jgi:type II secretory pathway component GspD/PulD (secretin)